MTLKLRRVLITVKTYPNPSKTHVETVCSAGIDIDTNEWVRLFPIPYRNLPYDKQFQKYDIIEVPCEKALRDSRPESHKVDAGAIRIIESVGTQDGWFSRRSFVMPLVSGSLCELLDQARANDRSLGAFLPCNIELEFGKAKPRDEEVVQATYAQGSLFDKPLQPIEHLDHAFYYRFACAGVADCPGHRLPILDWEIYQAYRKWRRTSRDESSTLQKVEEKWVGELCSPDRNTVFFVGNQKRFRENFMVIGVFWPPKSDQPALFD